MTTPTDTKPELIDGAELLDDVAATIARYVILPSTAASIAVVLWIAATHAVPAWNCAPRLVIRAPERRCGKSRLLDMVEGMSHRPLMTVNASPSAVYRSIGIAPNDPPTLLIDEADTIFGPKAGENEDLRGLLNAGHQRGRPALRYDAGSRSVETCGSLRPRWRGPRSTAPPLPAATSSTSVSSERRCSTSPSASWGSTAGSR